LKPLRILHTSEFYAPSVGGAQEVVRQLSERLAARGHEVTVATTALAARNGAEMRGVRIAGFGVSGNRVRGMDGDVEGYRRFVQNGAFDVVMNYAAQQWTTDALLDALPDLEAAKVLVPCGFSGLGDPLYRDYFERMPGWLGRYDACVYLSDSYRDVRFAREHGLANGRLIPNGAGSDEFEAPLSVDARARLGLRPDEFFVLSVGSHTALKGHAESAAILDASGAGNAALVIVGNRMKGGCTRGCAWRAFAGSWRPSWRRRRLRVLSVELDRPATVAAYRQADVFLFPSNVECSPLVLFESAAAGLPFLSSDAGNAREIAGWTAGGEVMDTRTDALGLSHASIADGAARLRSLWLDPARRRGLGEAGRAAWKERFTWERIAGDYERLYRELAR
jgi:glycosyltransferase involved in cell wall biosynthesis